MRNRFTVKQIENSFEIKEFFKGDRMDPTKAITDIETMLQKAIAKQKRRPTVDGLNSLARMVNSYRRLLETAKHLNEPKRPTVERSSDFTMCGLSSEDD